MSHRSFGAATALTSAIAAPSDERAGDDEHAGEPDVRIGVRHAAEDGAAAIVEQLLEPAEIDAHRQHQQHDRERQSTGRARRRRSRSRGRG